MNFDQIYSEYSLGTASSLCHTESILLRIPPPPNRGGGAARDMNTLQYITRERLDGFWPNFMWVPTWGKRPSLSFPTQVSYSVDPPTGVWAKRGDFGEVLHRVRNSPVAGKSAVFAVCVYFFLSENLVGQHFSWTVAWNCFRSSIYVCPYSVDVPFGGFEVVARRRAPSRGAKPKLVFSISRWLFELRSSYLVFGLMW